MSREGTRFKDFRQLFIPPTCKELASAKHDLPTMEVKSVLVVEDDPALRDILRTVAEGCFNVCVTTAPSISEATEHVLRAADDPPFDAILLDQQLTNGLGIDFYRFIMADWPSTKVVFLTGFFTVELCEKVAEVGPARVYSKTDILRPKFLQNLFLQFGITSRA